MGRCFFFFFFFFFFPLLIIYFVGMVTRAETEADRIGAVLMMKAGFDPRETILHWRRMEAFSKGIEDLEAAEATATSADDLRHAGCLPVSQCAVCRNACACFLSLGLIHSLDLPVFDSIDRWTCVCSWIFRHHMNHRRSRKLEDEAGFLTYYQ